jgi:hypothetical protein
MESEKHTTPEKEKEEQVFFTKEKAKKLLFLSFRFSQGSSPLQQLLFLWLHQRYPEWRIDEETAKQIEKESSHVFKKFLNGNNSPIHHTSATNEDIEDSLRVQINYMRDILEGKTLEEIMEETIKNPIPDITYKIIYRDNLYYDRGGRPGRRGTSEDNSPTPLEDKYLSHFCYYGLQGHPTGSKEFDQLFKEVRDYAITVVQEENMNIDLFDAINQVIRNYNIYHPDNRVSIEKGSRHHFEEFEED